MSHTVSGKLHKAPFIKQLQDSTMFAIKLCEVTKDRNTGEKSYVNYEAVLFAKTQSAIDFYTSATSEGSFVVVSCEKLQIKVSDCGQYTSLSMENARLENASYPQLQAPQQGSSQQQAAPQQQQAPAQVWSSQPQQQQPQQGFQKPSQQARQQPQQFVNQQQQQPQYSEQTMDFEDDIPF